MATDTYGFGGGDPTTGVPAGETAQSVKTGTGADAAPCTEPREGSDSPEIRGTVSSPKGPATWDEALEGTAGGEPVSYVGNTTSIGSGTANSLGGSWPVSGAALNPPLTKSLGDKDI